MTTLETTYEIVRDRPEPMAWAEYEPRLRRAWQELLDSNPSEPHIQSFLEKHPCLLPGPFNMPARSGHYPFPDAVVSQPSLAGIGQRVPDFAWFSTNSIELEPVLIELERPDKKWFTAAGDSSADFTHAQTQLAQWRDWFSLAANQQVFYEIFEVPLYLRHRHLHVVSVLIYGRRSECQDDQRLNRLRAQLQRQGEHLMSYDRLAPDPKASNLFCVKRHQNHYTAVAFPPTFALGPNGAERLLLVTDREQAIERCDWMSRERKDFVKERFAYWDQWARREDRGLVRDGDIE